MDLTMKEVKEMYPDAKDGEPITYCLRCKKWHPTKLTKKIDGIRICKTCIKEREIKLT